MKNFGVYRYIALIFTLLVVSTAVWGQTTYWIGGPGPASAAIPGNWSAGIPGEGDTAIINSDAQIEIPGSGTIGTAIVDVGCTVEFIIQAGTLTVETQLQNNGDLTISGPGDLMVIGTTQNANTRTLTIGAGGARNLGTLTNDGTLAVGANTVTTGLVSGGGLITVSTGTITATGTIANLETSDAATINLSGDITALTVVAGTPTLNGVVAGLTAGGNPGGAIITTGTVTLEGTNFTSITNSGTLTFNGAATLSGDMTLTAGSLTLGGDISVGGDLNLGAAFASGANNVSVTGDVTGTGPWTGGTGAIDIDGDFSLDTFTGGSGTVAIAGNFTGNDFTASTGSTYLSGTIVTFTTYDNNGGNLYLDGAGNQAFTTNDQALNNFQVTTGTSIVTVTGALTVGGTLNVDLNQTITLSNPMTVTGATTNNGTITGGAGTVTFNGIVTNNLTGVITAGPVAAGSDAIIFTDNYAGGGTLNGNATTDPDIHFQGATTTMGTVGINGDVIVFDSAIGQTFDPGPVNNYATITIDKATGTFTVDTNELVCDSFTITGPSAGAITFETNLTVTNGLAHTTGPTVIHGTVETTNNPVSIAALTLGGTVEINTSGGDIDISGAVTNAAAQNLTLNAGTGDIELLSTVGSVPNPLGAITITNANDVTFSDTVNAASIEQTTGSGTTTFVQNVTTSGAITITNANDVTFNGTINAASIEQVAGSGTTTFVQNVTTSGATGIAINTTNIVLDGLTMTAGTVASAGIALTGAVTLSTADVVLSAQDEIALGGTVDGDQSLTVNCNGYFVTVEDADITLIGASFTKTGNGISKLSGGISTTGAGTITFNTALLPADVYLLGSAGGAMTLACGNVDTAIVINGNLFVGETNLQVKTFNFESGIQATNCVLMHGTITLALTTTIPALSTTQDIVLLGSGYSIADPDTGIGDLFSYAHASRAGATAIAHTAIPTTAPGGPAISATYSTTIAATLPGKTLRVDGNFYANGVDLNPGAAWTLSIPDNDNALASFAEAYNLTLANCSVTTPGTFARLAAANATNGGANTNCAFSRPVILIDDGTQDTGDPLSGTYTVYDNVIRVELVDSVSGAPVVIENSNNEISAAVTNIQYLSGVIPVLVSFDDAYIDPDCDTSTFGQGDIISGVIYLQTDPGTDAYRWNTDATGTSAGEADSTDRGRGLILPAHRNSVPCIDLPAALGTVFQTIRDANKNRITHTSEDRTPINGTRFTDTADRCRPVLVEVRTGQELHDNVLGNQLPYDAHNFIELRYSERVDIGGFATAPLVGGIIYAKAMTDFTLATEWGGAISGSGPLTIAGYASIANGTLVTGTRGSYATPAPSDDDPTVHALYREFSLDGAAAPVNQPHRLRISIAGWCETLAPSFFWQGFITSAVSPSGIVTVPSNQFIRDQAATPNILEPTTSIASGYGINEYPKTAVSVNSTEADLYSDWDTTPPDFAALRTYTDNWDDPLSAYELNPLASPGGLVNRIEMHFYDNRIDYSNPSETWKWQSRTGWYETTTATIEHPAPENFGGARPDRQHTGPFPTQPTSGGIRDSSFHNVSSAFVIDNSGPTATGPDITNFTTGVNSPFYNILATLNVDDDPYITLHLNDLVLGWPIATASIQVTYTNWIDNNLNGGFVTDLAGNLLGSQANMQTLDRTPPEVTVSIAGANRDELYLVFSKEIGTGTTVPNGIELHLQNPATVLIPTAIETRPGSGQVLFFRLPQPITANQLVNPASEIRFIAHGPLVPNPETGVPEAVTAYSDTMGNYVSLAETHRITDIAVGLVDVLYASDGVNTDGIFGSNEGALRVFDGTGRLLDRNLTIATHLSVAPPAPLALTMYYDASAPAASLPGLFNSATGLTSRLWLPGVQPGFNTQGNPAARALGPDQILDADRLFRNFAISEADEDMVPGSDIDILFRYGDLYCARLEDPADLSSVAPWTIGIAETKRQRGGVTILNNVIDSRRRERTIVQVEVPEAGNIVIQVFTLDGNVVKVLERGRKGAGTYQYFWDGTNNGGRPVARGMYFIRVVGPDIDEIRKVMVVKE